MNLLCSQHFHDTAGELLEFSNLKDDLESVGLALLVLREIALDAIRDRDLSQMASGRRLKRVLRLYGIAKKLSPSGDLLDVAEEILLWIETESNSPTDSESQTQQLLRFLAEEAAPSDLLQAMQLWTSHLKSALTVHIVPVLQSVLRKATDHPISNEFSGALLRVRRARLRMDLDSPPVKSTSHETEKTETSIWKRMAGGMVIVAK